MLIFGEGIDSGCSLAFMESVKPLQKQSDQSSAAVAASGQYPHGDESLKLSLDEVSLPLSTILGMCSSPEHGEFEMRNLAQNDQSYHHLRALRDLWQSLGCPDSLLWLETRVFCNRLANAPKAV